VQLAGEVSDDQHGESYPRETRTCSGSYLVQSTPLKGAAMSVKDRKQEVKNVSAFTYLPFPKRDERARALQTSTTHHGQSSVLSAEDRCSTEASRHGNAGQMGSLDIW